VYPAKARICVISVPFSVFSGFSNFLLKFLLVAS
jgi:hypothetical protein